MRKFMRTRAAEAPSPPPPALPPDVFTALNGHAPKTNGHANGGGAGAGTHADAGALRDDRHSTLSRSWSGSEGSAPGAPAGARAVPGPGAGAGAGAGGGALFEDAAFPATWRALGERRLARDLRWLRPHELCARPRFRGDHRHEREREHEREHEHERDGDASGDSDEEPPDQLAARWRVVAGEAGAPHACRAAAALALAPRLLDRVAPPQSFRRRYTGAFRFRFWVFGAWREVVVDDRLPVRGAAGGGEGGGGDTGGRLLASRAALHDDFTLPLLEKAYAKLYGSYAALRGGSVARALQELSGGIVQSFSLRLQPRALTFQVLNSAVPRSTLLVAGAAQARGGLLPGQPYCVTGLARVRGAGAEGAGAGGAGAAGAGALVRLRAAGGRGAWRGAWAPDSAEWRALAPPDRELLAPRADRPGDFWMCFGDFVRSFDQLELVHVGPDDWLLERALQAKRPWRAVLARRRWRTGYNAGGPPRCADTTSTNPQFHVQIPHSEVAGARKCHVVVSVMQQYDVGAAAGKLRAIGFAVYELPPAGAPRAGRAALRGLRALDVTHESRAREVVTFFTLPPGRYLLVPHTRRPHTDAAFLLRVLTDEQTDVWEVNEDNVIVRDVSAEFLDDAQSMPVSRRAWAVRGGAGAARRLTSRSVAGGGARGGAAAGRGGRGRGRAGRGRAARGAAARVARVPVRAPVAGAVPRAGAAARPRAGGLHARARRAGAGGAAGLLAPRLPAAGRRAALRRGGRVVVPAARAAVGGRRHGVQQGAGVPGAALRAQGRAHRGGLRHGAGAAAPGARAIPQSGHQDEIQPAVSGGDDPDDDLLVSGGGALRTLRQPTLLIVDFFLLSVLNIIIRSLCFQSYYIHIVKII